MSTLCDRWCRYKAHRQSAQARVCPTCAIYLIQRYDDTVLCQRFSRHRPQAEVLLQIFDGAECVKEVRGVSLCHLQLHSFVHLLPDDVLTCRMFVAGSQKARIRAATVRQETLRPLSGCCRCIFPLRKEPDDIDGGVSREYTHTHTEEPCQRRYILRR